MQLEQELFGARFQNPVLLAAGTCGFGRELAGVVELDRLGGLVTKSVTLEPRAGNPRPRVSEGAGLMVNSIGLANPGVERVKAEKLPWLASRLRRAQVFVSVAGHAVQDYCEIVEHLEPEGGFLGFELNLSCPNVPLGGVPFALDTRMLAKVVGRVRGITARPLLVKLAPNSPDVGAAAEAAVAAGGDGVTLVNTMPGMVIDPETRRPRLGAGGGGLSGPALLPVGVHAVWQASRRVRAPLVGVGGVRGHRDCLQYLLAGASLVQVGTATFADPRSAERVVHGLSAYGRRRNIGAVAELVGAVRSPEGPVPFARREACVS
ncbi:MAG: dihydroorotate dehydrogenase [Gammaproteobacteria bacterium]|nr:dihydroorotate dehydrogenase [Gammaproteobacteria bacterium]MYF62462.1 dihydroorotate dehydrogenase [Gammaproteobacteria bacterium]MYI21301.1 dihydroorotate dehydrogenase [Gammaproteobacteria bacterium]